VIARLGLLRTAALAGLALASLLLLFVASSRGADVTTFTVTSLDDEAGVETCEPNSDCTLREAIQSISEEEEENGRYKIVFTVQGTIELAEQLILYSEEEGVEVEIEGPGSALLTVDGSGNGRVLTARDVNLTMSGVTLTGGEESGVIHGGGGLLVDSAGATLTDVDITDNEIGGDGAGGGIAVEGEVALQLY
jgi:CSLREA domain-containing protein